MYLKLSGGNHATLQWSYFEKHSKMVTVKEGGHSSGKA